VLEKSQSEDRRIRMFEKPEQENRRSTAISQKHHRIDSFIERTGGYIEERVFGNFQNFREPRFKMSEPGFWIFSPPSDKGVNTRTDNLRVQSAGSDTRTTLVGTTALSHNIVFICGDINALWWDPRVLFWENFGLWRPNRMFEVVGVA
jgi:hypothetical protein